MRMESTALLIGAGVLGIYFYNKSRAAGRLNFFPGQVRKFYFDGGTPVAEVDVIAQNTSNTNLTLNSFAGNVLTSNTIVGNVSNFTAVQIQNNSQGAIPVTIRFNALGIVNELLQAWQTNSFAKSLTIDGFVNADGVQVPVKLTFKIGL